MGGVDDETDPGDLLDLLERFGEAAGEALVADDPGDADGRTGWRGALQAAADESRDDPGILQVADDIYAAASRLSTPAAVRAHAAAARSAAAPGPVRAFLDGLTEGAEDHRPTDGVH